MAPNYDSTVETEAYVSEIGSRTANTISYVLLGKFASLIFAGIAFIVVARVLGPSTYGIYTLALAVSGFFGSVGNLGVSTALNKFIPEYILRKDKKSLEAILANGYFITITFGVVLAVITVAFGPAIANYVFHNPSYTYFIDIAALSIISSMLFGASYSVLLGFNNGSRVAAINIVQAIIQSGVGITLVLLGLGAAAPIFGIVIGQMSGFFYSLYLIYGKNRIRMLVSPSVKEIRRIFKFSLPIAGSNLLQSISSNLSFIVLGAFAATIIIGNVGIATKFNSLIDVVSGSISVSLLALFSTTIAGSKMKDKMGKLYSYTLYYTFILLSPMLLFIAILAKPFSYVAFSSIYQSAPLFISVMCIGTLIGIAGTYASTLLTSANMVKYILKYNAIIAVVQLAALPFIIPIFKGIGLIVLVYVITPILTDALFIWKSSRLYSLKFDFNKLYRISAANAVPMLLLVPLVVLWGGNYIPLLITGFVEVVIVYPITLARFRGIDKKDVARIRSMSHGIPVVGYVMGALLKYATIFF
jgi:PST family polysaccharide transporter/lipopolysaccharide exporter